ncbi:elongation factor P--(R)-beta-lysine ligase [Arsenophonus nasoniae]|uniref:Elongation factor P--(R)-beta-lysine ligase n=1 Tax=Arsenophonus nasoniae TaxID=638 RepID=D2U2J0_9GAMM|nr:MULTISPECIES: elongation factor P--(R)-beta-lysine ligase [Arsenophonus]QBY45375.1 Elongation factor P--(R)-beta-lysine ligase [Arsenophonus nasoniae]WGL98089.1 elongation factor P--(R)-beta-lysine ligase [Arsenophonus sp. aPb]WGM01355.1 elongation factor P--(R)-beta-lysine ligase [Arsenophonus nasoniae]WGM05532.1 elongation factor P--(R)-beta-lysine ligase [Arsenophonus nasoniae]WGM10544.1 elongation factor P--(R)-beta-lysine ligase [Arsenophonus nasoniae]
MSEVVNWQPSASINNLLKRAKIIAEIRRFFIDRGVVEVETPILSKFTVTDIHLSPFETQFIAPVIADSTKLYMITSPEYHMKRLLAAGSGPIYQIIKAFRNEEEGRYHNPEFTMLEWYRPHYDMYRLIDEVDDLLQQILDCQPTERISYQQAFQRYLNIDPLALESERKQLRDAAVKLGLNNAETEEDKDVLLQFLFTMGVEPNLGKDKPTVIYHFPASQAALAEISKEDHRVAERFEVYFKGIELANGFRELTDAQEQRERFEHDNQIREKMGLPEQPIDECLLAALDKVIPDCSGVALGIDRLVMLALNAEKISDVISFSIERA